MTAFAVSITAVIFCMAGILAKNSREIKELQHRMDSPMFGPMIEDHDHDDRS